MKKIFTILAFLGPHMLAMSQYVTPGTETTYTFEDLVDLSMGTVTLEGVNEYHIHDDLTISATDTLIVFDNITVKVAAAKRILVNGTMISDPQEQAIFTAIDPEVNFKGFRFDQSPSSILRNTTIEYGGGIQLLDSDMIIEDCIIRYNDRSNTSAAINLSNSSPLIQNNTFLENGGSAIGSGANIIAAPRVLNNQLIRNSTENTNRPQINLGPTGEDTLKVIGNVVEGFYTMAGGIAVSNLLAVGNSVALIEDNLVFGNRYGYTATGNNIMSIIRKNHFLDNNIQGEPNLGGSGLNFYGTSTTNTALVYNNVIQGNLWGVTIQGNAQPNLGDVNDPMTGFNVIENNTNNSQIFGLYNNTPEAIMAQNNYWGTLDEETAGQYIVGEHQDPTLGPVTFIPLWEPQNLIEEFVFPASLNDAISEDVTGVIDQDAQTIIISLPYDTEVTDLTPQIVISDFASVMPQSEQPVDFSQPVVYTVTSFHEADRVYDISVVVMDPPTFTLTFDVTDPDGNPITEATVTLNGETQPAGIYVFSELLPGSYNYMVELQGYYSADGTVEIEDDDVLAVVILEPETSITGPELVNGMAVYPNPARNFIEINFNNKIQGNILRIYSITGTLVLETSNINPMQSLDVSSLENGLYLLQFHQGNNTLTRKLTIRR